MSDILQILQPLELIPRIFATSFMLCFEFSSIFNLFSPWRDNNSYGYYTKVSDSTGDLTFNYGDVFSEYTNADAKISCSGEKTCYVGCTCKSGWNGKKDITSSGSNLTTAGAGADLSGNYTIADSGSAAKTTASTSGLNISTMATGDSCTISVTDPRYGVTCTQPSAYDCAGVCGGSASFKCTSGSTDSDCDTGYYSVYLGKQKCTSGSATNSTSCYTCKQCTWVCPNGYYTSGSTDYKLTSTSTAKVCSGDTSQKHSSAKCYTRTLKGCSDYNSSYKTSAPSGQTCTEVEPRDGLICYKDCKATCPDGYYTTKPGSAFKYDKDTSTSLTCYKVTGCSSGYHSYNWTDIKDAYVKKTYTYDPQNYKCYTYTCASGYTALKSGYTCTSGIECSYNGGNCCCPNGNLEKDEEEDDDGYFTVIAKIDYSCVSDEVSLALIDGKGTYYSSGTTTSGMTVTTIGVPGKGEIGMCVSHKNGRGMGAFRVYVDSEGGSNNCYTDNPSGSYSSCRKTDRVSSVDPTKGCSFANYTFSAGHTYIIKGVGCQ